MLKLEGQTTIVAGNRKRKISVWEDDEIPNKVYILPTNPAIRVNNGKPVFQFVNYRDDVPKEVNGEPVNMGGIAFFDVDLAVTEDERATIQAKVLARINKGLPDQRKFTQIEFGALPYTDGSVRLNIEDMNGSIVQSVISDGRPSLFGDNIATFTAEFTTLGASIFEDVLKNGGSGAISVTYDLYISALLPAVVADIKFDARQFKSFTEEQQGGGWGGDKTQTIKTHLEKDESLKIELDFKDANISEELRTKVRDWAQGVGEDMIARQIDPDMDVVGKRKTIGDAGRWGSMKYEDTLEAITDFHQRYAENSAINIQITPQAFLSNIAKMVGSDGNQLIKPEEVDQYFRTVDETNDFFKMIRVAIKPNTDYDVLNINDLQVKLEYSDNEPKEFLFSADESGTKTYQAYLADDKSREYTYSYQVNFKMDAFGNFPTFQSDPYTSSDDILTVTTDDVGVFRVSGFAKNMDWDLIARVLLTIKYEDPERGIDLFSHSIELSSSNTEFNYSRALMQPWDKPYTYQLHYTFNDGTEFEDEAKTELSPILYLNDPFTPKEYTLRANGLLSDINAMYLQVTYTEDSGLQFHRDLIFQQGSVQQKIKFPSLTPGSGQISYSGTIEKADGNIDRIDSVTTTERHIDFGRVRSDVRTIEIETGELDFDNKFKRVKIMVQHGGSKETFAFREEDDVEWLFDMADANDTTFNWRAEIEFDDKMRKKFFKRVYLPGPTRHEWNSSEEKQLILEDELLSDRDIAEEKELFMLEVSKDGIDFSEVDDLRIEVNVLYDRKKGRVQPVVDGRAERFFEEGNGEDDPKGIFLAKLIDDEGIDPLAYQWQAAYHIKGEDTIYYPGPTKREWAEGNGSEIYLSDNLSEDFGGTLTE